MADDGADQVVPDVEEERQQGWASWEFIGGRVKAPEQSRRNPSDEAADGNSDRHSMPSTI